MEKAAAAGKAGDRWEWRAAGRWHVLALAAFAGCPAAWAQDAGQLPAQVLVAQARTDAPVRMEVQTSTLPRLESQDSGFQAPRVDLSLFPTRPTALGNLGPVLGFSNLGARHGHLGLAPDRPSVDLGLRWTHRLPGRHQIDVMAWRRLNTPDDAYTMTLVRPPVYGARVEMNLKPASSKLFQGGFVGLQLQSGAKISIKRKNGGPMIYYRTTF